MNSSLTSLIVFDLGGVLVRINHGWKNACAAVGIHAHPALESESALAELTTVGQRYETGRCDESNFYDDIVRFTGFTRDEVQRTLHHWLIEPYPGAADLLHRVAECAAKNGIATACLSNTNATHWAMMQGQHRLGHATIPLHRLNHRFASHIIGAMKPDPRIYEHLEQATRVDPASILFFDDFAANIDAARARGWQAERIDNAGDTVAQITEHLRRRGIDV